ncbi:MAG: glycosyltransferase family 4 protein [Ignavibacteriales bacterium]|nr:glycosyltransferase family 4 protein [Ignavibacteriales bacterium]
MTDGFRKVLMIAYYFPPLGLSGVQRTVKFAKYLLKYGWKPTVLTVVPKGYYAYDESLLKEAEDAGIQIVRTNSLDANKLFKKKVIKTPSERTRKVLRYCSDLVFIPDNKIGWKRNALRKGAELLAGESFDIIYATAPPQTDFLIGLGLKKKFGLPLVVDYRDSWLEYPFKYFPTPLHKWLNKRLERKVLKSADRIVVAHRRIKETILKTHRHLTYHDVAIIPHGYDAEDIPARFERSGSAKKMVVAHAGTFYGGRTPKVLLTAFANLLKHDEQWRERIEFVLIGNKRKDETKLVEHLGVAPHVRFTGYLEHGACVRELMAADVLWYALDHDILSPGKLYEYFGTRKPILASIVEGYTQQLIKESGAARVVPIHDVAAHEAALKELYAQFVQKQLPKPSPEFVDGFDRQNLTGELARIFQFLMDYDKGTFTKVEEAA